MILIFLMLATGSLAAQPKTLRVLQFNIWQEGTVIPGGFGAIVDEIVRLEADVVALSEVRNYHGADLGQRLVAALADRGLTYYATRSDDTGILSRYPITKQTALFPWIDDRGSVTKAIIQVEGYELAFYSAHLDYRNCALYLPRGYDGSTWAKLPAAVTDTALIAADNRQSKRDEAIGAIVADAAAEKAAGRLVILGGDFNEPSHRDWNQATKNQYDHNGVVFEWPNTKTLESAGFRDGYRELFPNPLTHPGFTFPADNPLADLKKLAWSPTADDRDRIDFVFYQPDDRLALRTAKIVGPQGSIVRNQRVPETASDPIDIPPGIWPTDHKAVLAEFQLQ